MIRINLIQEKEVAKLVEWHRRVREYLKHHVTLAPVKTVACFLVFLPVSTEFPLEEKWIVKFGNVLEFINADHYLYPLRLRDTFRKVENFIGISLHLLPVKVDGNFVHRVGSNGYLWNQVGEKLLCVIYGLIPSGSSSLYDATGENRIKLLFGLYIEKVYRAYFEMFVIILGDGCSPVNERTLSPTPWGNNDCIDERLEIINQMGSLLLPVSKILVCGYLAEYERCFHSIVLFTSTKV